MVRSTDMQKDQEMELDGAGVVDTGGDESPMAVYEVGYHLLPTLSESDVQKAVSGLMDLIKGEKGSVVGDTSPSKIDLAYEMVKRVDGKNMRYREAYFGWVAFEMAKDAVGKVKEALDMNPSVLRYLIIATSREAVQAALSGATEMQMPSAPAPTGNIEKPKRDTEEGGEVSEAALDEALGAIASEDTK